MSQGVQKFQGTVGEVIVIISNVEVDRHILAGIGRQQRQG